MPEDIVFPARIDGAIRISAWNICGLAASQKKVRVFTGFDALYRLLPQGFQSYVEAEDPDVLVLTETKVNNEPVDPALTKRFPYRYWSISDKKTYCKCFILFS